MTAVVVDDGQDPAKNQHDNWHKELRDARQFDTMRAAQLLVVPASLPAALCRVPVSWVVGPVAAAEPYPYLRLVAASAGVRDMRLWCIDAGVGPVFNALGCEGTPSVGSASR